MLCSQMTIVVKPLPLFRRIGKLVKSIREFNALDVQLETFGDRRVFLAYAR